MPKENKGKKMAKKLVGYSRFNSKKGIPLCIAQLVTDLAARDFENGAVGQKVETVFMPKNQYDYLKPEHIGKEFIESYYISQGKAFLQNVTVK